MIKAVIFDVGGVLISNLGEKMFEDISRTLDLDIADVEKAFWQVIPLLDTGKIDEQEFWKRYLKLTQTKKHLPGESLLMREYVKNYRIHEDVFDIVRALKRNRYHLALLSNTIMPHAEYNREKRIFDLFNTLVFSHEVGLRKPEPEIYKLIITKLQILPYESVFIDDLEENIIPAKKLGMQGIIFKDAKQLKNDLELIGANLSL